MLPSWGLKPRLAANFKIHPLLVNNGLRFIKTNDSSSDPRENEIFNARICQTRTEIQHHLWGMTNMCCCQNRWTVVSNLCAYCVCHDEFSRSKLVTELRNRLKASCMWWIENWYFLLELLSIERFVNDDDNFYDRSNF